MELFFSVDTLNLGMICPYWAVGCGRHIRTQGGQIITVEGNLHSPINEETLCRFCRRQGSWQSP